MLHLVSYLAYSSTLKTGLFPVWPTLCPLMTKAMFLLNAGLALNYMALTAYKTVLSICILIVPILLPLTKCCLAFQNVIITQSNKNYQIVT
jgi:hypothetical protein